MLCFDSLPQLSALLFCCCCCFLFPSVSLSVSVFGVLNFLFRIGKRLCVMTMATCHSRYLETSINFCLPSKISVRDRGFTRNAATLRFRGPSPHCVGILSSLLSLGLFPPSFSPFFCCKKLVNFSRGMVGVSFDSQVKCCALFPLMFTKNLKEPFYIRTFQCSDHP